MTFQGLTRVPAQRKAARADEMRVKAFPAPTKGWLSAANLSAVPPGYAQLLENWFPTTTGIKVRKGSILWGTAVAAGAHPLESLFTYVGGNRQLFAGCNGSIFPMTSPSTPTTIPTPVVTGQTSNYYCAANIETAGGNFMTVVNGSDFAQLYNGSTWEQQTAVSAHAITGVLTNLLSFVWVSGQRMWFVQKGTMTAWFLPTGSFAGAAQSVSLAGVFRLGGTLVLGAQWSANTGTGLVNFTVFISSEGEYAIYSGNDPTTAAGFVLVGVYYGSPPLGANHNATMIAGSDLLVLTQAGLVSMTQIQTKDPAALSISGVSRAISPDWIAEQQTRRSKPWEIIKWPSKSYAIVNCPVIDSTTPAISFVVNLETGAWCKYTGWDTRCLALHADQLYFGTNTGTVVEAEVGGADQGGLYYSNCAYHMDHLGQIGVTKTAKQIRAIFRTLNDFIPQISVSTDYVVTLPTPPNAVVFSSAPDVWDTGLWDVAKWDAGQSLYLVNTYWVSADMTGFAHAPVLQVTHGAAIAPSAELVVMEMTYDVGALVV